MRIARLLIIPGLLLAAACGGDDDTHTAQQQTVPVWTADSARDRAEPAPVVPTDTAPAFPDDPSADTGNLASPVAGEPASAPAPAPAAATEPPAQSRASSAEEILLRAERAYESVRTLQADFVQDLTVPLLNDTQRSRGEIFHRKPDRFLMRFSDPAGDVVVADGEALWLYYPSTDPGQVIRTSMGQAGRLDLQREFLSNPTQRFDATLEGTESVNGRSASVLTLIPRSPSGYSRVRIWIDQEDALARRFEITEDNDNVRRVELSNLQVNVDLPDELFAFTPPEGVQVFEQ